MECTTQALADLPRKRASTSTEKWARWSPDTRWGEFKQKPMHPHHPPYTRDLVPPSNPNPPPPCTGCMPKYSCLQVCGQSINMKMVIRAETCSWYLGRHNSTHAPTSPSLLNTHEISYPPPPYTRRMPKYSCLQVLLSIYQPEDGHKSRNM